MKSEHRDALRGAMNTGDGAEFVRLLKARVWPDCSLQMIGDGLLSAVEQHIPDGLELAAHCVEQLRERDWEGDSELADQLAGRLGARATPMLRALSVRLEELADILEGDPVDCGGRIDLRNGEVWPRSLIEYERESRADADEDDDDDPERWLWVDGIGSRAGYRDMQEFIDTITDSDRADRLGIAIQGRGAFRRFRTVLDRWPAELTRWYAFAEDRQRGRARSWLANEGYRPTVTALKT